MNTCKEGINEVEVTQEELDKRFELLPEEIQTSLSKQNEEIESISEQIHEYSAEIRELENKLCILVDLFESRSQKTEALEKALFNALDVAPSANENDPTDELRLIDVRKGRRQKRVGEIPPH